MSLSITQNPQTYLMLITIQNGFLTVFVAVVDVCLYYVTAGNSLALVESHSLIVVFSLGHIMLVRRLLKITSSFAYLSQPFLFYCPRSTLIPYPHRPTLGRTCVHLLTLWWKAPRSPSQLQGSVSEISHKKCFF